MSNFLRELLAGNAVAIAIVFLAIFIPANLFLAVRSGRRKRRICRQISRHNGYSHRLKVVQPPAPLRAVPALPPPVQRDAWAPSAREGNGRPGPPIGFQDEVAKNADRHRRSLP